jgi:hypothetical protein
LLERRFGTDTPDRRRRIRHHVHERAELDGRRRIGDDVGCDDEHGRDVDDRRDDHECDHDGQRRIGRRIDDQRR